MLRLGVAGVARRAAGRQVERVIQRCMSGTAAAEAEGTHNGKLFPRTGPGVDYSLNWALAAVGIPPTGQAFRNLKPDKLQEHGAADKAGPAPSELYVEGATDGAKSITKAQFTRLSKEVAAYLSGASKLYVHDGAVGSSEKSAVAVRSVSDSPTGAMSVRELLTPTPLTKKSAVDFPLRLLLASSYKSSAPSKHGLESSSGFVAASIERAAVIVAGNAVGPAVQAAIAAVAAPHLLQTGALPLFAAIVNGGESTALVLGSADVLSKLESATSSPGLIWSSDGVARMFGSSSSLPNLMKHPDAVVVAFHDSSGVVPPVHKVSSSSAAYAFLAGSTDKGFAPAYAPLPLGDAVPLAQKLKSLIDETKAAAYVANPADSNIADLVASALAGKNKKGTKKAAQEGAEGDSLKDRLKKFMAEKYPDLPQELADGAVL
eukprot:jgi/Chlat1/5320/Chrsp35S05257